MRSLAFLMKLLLITLILLKCVPFSNATPRMRELRFYANDRIKVMVNEGDPVLKGYLLAKMLQDFNGNFFDDSLYFFVMIGEEKPYGEGTDTSYYYAGFNIDTFPTHFSKLIQRRHEEYFSHGVARNALCIYMNKRYDYLECFSFLYYMLSHKEDVINRQTQKMFERTDDEPDRFADVVSLPDSSELRAARDKMKLFLQRRFNVGHPLFNTGNFPVSVFFSSDRFHLYTLERNEYEKGNENVLSSKVIGSFKDLYFVHTFDQNNLLVVAGDGYYYINVPGKRVSGPFEIKPVIPGYWGEIMFDYVYSAGERVFIDVHDNLTISYTLVYNDSTKELAIDPESITKAELRYYFNFFQRQMNDSINWSKTHPITSTKVISNAENLRTYSFLVVFAIASICFGLLSRRIN